MYQTASRVLDHLQTVITSWPEVEGITRLPFPPAAQDLLPIIKVDVYYRKNIPSALEREGLINPTKFFETSHARQKDRFFLGDIPVHVDYKSAPRTEALIQELLDLGESTQEHTTYGLYRIARGIPLFEPGDWLRRRRDELDRLPGKFWSSHRHNLESRLEHLAADMGQAELLGDDYMFLKGFSGFMEGLLELLFTLNGEFLPSEEMTAMELSGLEVLPSGFSAAFDLLLRDGALDRGRRRELAVKTLQSVMKL